MSSLSARNIAFVQPATLLVSHGMLPCCRISQKPPNRLHVSHHKHRSNVRRRFARKRYSSPAAEYPSCVPAAAAKEIQDATARSLLRDIQVVPVRTELCKEPIETAFVQTGKGSPSDPILIFVHSFDSNLLEFRRIWPLLKHARATSYAVDVLGWGFTSKPKHLAYSVEEKRKHLRSFVKQVIGDSPVVFVGASVGGAVAIDFCLKYPDDVSQLVLIGAQAFVNKESSPILEKLKPLAALGAAVLKAQWLRRIAVRLSYVSPELRNEDSMRVGRLHTLTPGWEYATEKFIAGRGYCLAEDVCRIECPVLVLYGLQDSIVPSGANSERFNSELPNGCRSIAIDLCGHSPHIEQPGQTASEIFKWVLDDSQQHRSATPTD